MGDSPSRMDLIRKHFGGGKLKEARASLDSNWLREGHYVMRIDRVKLDQNRKEQTGFFIEMTCLHAYSAYEEVPPHTPGDNPTQAIWAHFDSFLGNVKHFISRAVGVPATEVDETHVDLVTADDQPLSGTVMEVKGRTIMTQRNKPFNKVTYVREIAAKELKALLSEKVKTEFFPDNLLDQMEELED